MFDQPNAGALLEIVSEILRTTIIPSLDGAEAYQARIAANLVLTAAREIDAGPAADAAELERLRVLLGAAGDLRTLNIALSERIAAGTLTLDDPDVADHLWQTTLAKIRVDQPKYPRLHQGG